MAHFLVVEQGAELGKMLLEAYIEWKAIGGSERELVVYILCCQSTFLFEVFSFYGASVMSEGPNFDHSARLEPAIPKGFLWSRV